MMRFIISKTEGQLPRIKSWRLFMGFGRSGERMPGTDDDKSRVCPGSGSSNTILTTSNMCGAKDVGSLREHDISS